MPSEILPSSEEQTFENCDKDTRKAYRKPQFENLGDIRTLTLGLSPGPFDSSGGNVNEHGF